MTEALWRDLALEPHCWKQQQVLDLQRQLNQSGNISGCVCYRRSCGGWFLLTESLGPQIDS